MFSLTRLAGRNTAVQVRAYYTVTIQWCPYWICTLPDWVFVSGWNEFVAQPQPNPYTGDPFARSVGLERDP